MISQEKLESINEYSIIDAPLYNVQDITFRFGIDQFYSLMSEKLTEIGQFTGEIKNNQSIRVNDIKFYEEDKNWWIEATVQEELLQ